jgi:hypothetical protein
MTTIEQKLEQLHLVETEYDAVETNLENERDGKIFDLLGFELFTKLQTLKADFEVLLAQASEQRQTAVNTLHDEIKAETLQHGATVKAAHYMAVYAQPKPAWDNGKLEGFALVHPEILQCRTEKPPYVSLRKLK